MNAQLKPIGLTDKEARAFSISKLMRAMIETEWGLKHAGFELAACDATAAQYQVTRGGYYLPPEIRALTATGGGASLVETQVETQWWAHALTVNAKVLQLGAQVVTSDNSVALPRIRPGTTPAAVAENASLAASDPTFEVTTYAPKTLTNNVTISRRLLAVTGNFAETVVRADLAEAIAVLIDQYAIAGTGTPQPTGILSTAGLTISAIGVNGGAPTFANIIDMERQVSTRKGAKGKLGFLGNTKVRATMRGIVKTSGFDFLWQDDPTPGSEGTADGIVMGYPAGVSDNVPSNGVKGTGTNLSSFIFGNWADLYVVQFGPLAILADPYTFSNTGAVRYNVFQEVDIAPRHVDSFCAITDMIAS